MKLGTLSLHSPFGAKYDRTARPIGVRTFRHKGEHHAKTRIPEGRSRRVRRLRLSIGRRRGPQPKKFNGTKPGTPSSWARALPRPERTTKPSARGEARIADWNGRQAKEGMKIDAPKIRIITYIWCVFLTNSPDASDAFRLRSSEEENFFLFYIQTNPQTPSP